MFYLSSLSRTTAVYVDLIQASYKDAKTCVQSCIFRGKFSLHLITDRQSTRKLWNVDRMLTTLNVVVLLVLGSQWNATIFSQWCKISRELLVNDVWCTRETQKHKLPSQRTSSDGSVLVNVYSATQHIRPSPVLAAQQLEHASLDYFRNRLIASRLYYYYYYYYDQVTETIINK